MLLKPEAPAGEGQAGEEEGDPENEDPAAANGGPPVQPIRHLPSLR